jgi:hypothetical protein
MALEWCQTYLAIPQEYGISRIVYGVRGDSNIKRYMCASYLFDPNQMKCQHMLCFPHTRGNNILEVNEVESWNHLFKPFTNYRFAWGFRSMCLVATDWWLQRRLLWDFKCSRYSNGYLQRECNVRWSIKEELHQIRSNQAYLVEFFF